VLLLNPRDLLHLIGQLAKMVVKGLCLSQELACDQHGIGQLRAPCLEGEGAYVEAIDALCPHGKASGD